MIIFQRKCVRCTLYMVMLMCFNIHEYVREQKVNQQIVSVRVPATINLRFHSDGFSPMFMPLLQALHHSRSSDFIAIQTQMHGCVCECVCVFVVH